MSAVVRAARWLPALAAMAAIAWSSHQTTWPDPVVGYPDWLLHGVTFGVLAGTVMFALHRRGDRRRWRIAAIAVAVASLYGVVDEVHQGFIAERDASALDWVADTIGAAVAAAIVTLWRRR